MTHYSGTTRSSTESTNLGTHNKYFACTKFRKSRTSREYSKNFFHTKISKSIFGKLLVTYTILQVFYKILQNVYEVLALAWSMLPVQPTHLWDDGDAGPEVVQTQGAHIHIINHYLPTNWFHNAEESKREGRLPSTSATYDANLHDTEQPGLD